MDLKDRRIKDALKTLIVLEQAGFVARFAGGCVRDRLMGIHPTDYDVATSATPDQTSGVFRSQGYKVVPTGIDHGTVTVIAPSGPVEITTLRRDVATDGRRAQVAFGTNFEEDAERRDFTINAMFEDARGQIYDYFEGRKDLAEKALRFVGNAETRIREDYLRILRLFRFWAKIDFTPVPGTLEAVVAEKSGLGGISQERITSELLKTLAGNFAGAPLAALHSSGVWDLVIPELSLPKNVMRTPLPQAFWPLPDVVPAERRGVAALGASCLWEWHERDESAWTVLGVRLRLSRADVRAFAFFPVLLDRIRSLGDEKADALLLSDDCDHHAGRDTLTSFYGPILKALTVVKATEVVPLAQNIDRLLRTEALSGHLRQSSSPLSGKDLMNLLSLAPSPELGQALHVLKRGYFNGAWTTRDEGIAYIKKHGSF